MKVQDAKRRLALAFEAGTGFLSFRKSRSWSTWSLGRAAKLMSFTDNRQDASLQAGASTWQRQRPDDWDAVVLDATTRRMVRTDFELFFEREDWFRQHNLPYRRGYLLWGPPGNGKTAVIRVMAAHPYIQPYSLDLSDSEEKSSDVLHVFETAAENTPALVILEDLDRLSHRGQAHTGKDGEFPDIA